jgi:hypothetical protein
MEFIWLFNKSYGSAHAHERSYEREQVVFAHIAREREL